MPDETIGSPTKEDWVERASAAEYPAGRVFSTQYRAWRPPEWPIGTDNGEYAM